MPFWDDGGMTMTFLGGVRISSTPLRYIWDYWEPSAVHSLPGDSAIISVALCPARSEAFDEAPEFLLVMATELHGWMVFLMVFVGLCHQTIGIFSFFGCEFFREETEKILKIFWDLFSISYISCFPKKPCQATRLSVTLVGLSGAWSGSRLQLKTLGFSAPTDGAFFHSIRSTAGGRIFLLSGAPQIYELCYGSEGWFRSKCRLLRHSVGLGGTGGSGDQWEMSIGGYCMPSPEHQLVWLVASHIVMFNHIWDDDP